MKKLLGIIAVILIGVTVLVFAMGPEMDRRERQRRKNVERSQAAKRERDKREEAAQENLKKYSERMAERAKGPREAGFDQGFQLGFMGGKLTRSKTNIAPSSEKIETLAMQQLDKQNVPADSHAGFVRGFKAGWSSGWTSK